MSPRKDSAISSTVAVVRCESYNTHDVNDAVARGISLLGDLHFSPGQNVLLKPNLLQAAKPDKPVCTHPEVFRAVLTFLSDLQVELSYGDSPAVANPVQAAKVGGYADIADAMSIPFADFKTAVSVETPQGCRIKKFDIAAGVSAADAVVSISKMKTHSFTGMTGAVKNCLGCVPGMRKAEFHVSHPDPDSFSRMLVELALAVRPCLHIMDGIVAMEGKGPGSGTPKPMNVLLFSRDPVALDTVAATLMRFDTSDIGVLKYGKLLGLGNPETFDVVGDDLESFRPATFEHPEISHYQSNSVPVSLARRWILSRPVVNSGPCTRCGQCVAICPVSPKAMNFKSRENPPLVTPKRCIRCFCCQEVCPDHAIDIKTPIAGKMMHLVSRN